MSIPPLLLLGLAGFMRLYVQMQFKSLYSEFLGLLLWKLERWWNLFVMVLKTRRTGWFNWFNWEPDLNPVRLLFKIGNERKTRQTRQTAGSTGITGNRCGYIGFSISS